MPISTGSNANTSQFFVVVFFFSVENFSLLNLKTVKLFFPNDLNLSAMLIPRTGFAIS